MAHLIWVNRMNSKYDLNPLVSDVVDLLFYGFIMLMA